MNEKKLIRLLNQLGQSRYNEGRADQLGEPLLAFEASQIANEVEILILELFNRDS